MACYFWKSFCGLVWYHGDSPVCFVWAVITPSGYEFSPFLYSKFSPHFAVLEGGGMPKNEMGWFYDPRSFEPFLSNALLKVISVFIILGGQED